MTRIIGPKAVMMLNTKLPMKSLCRHPINLFIILGLSALLCACKPEPILPGSSYVLRQSTLNITLSFDAHGDRYFGQAVNRYYGTYRIQGGAISFGSPYSNMMPSDEEDMVAEEAYLTDLTQAKTYRLTDDTLVLTLSDDRHLIFDKRR